MEKSHFSSTFALAFGKPVALTNDLVVVEATAASALPTHSRSSWGPRKARQHCSQQGNIVGVNNKLLTINY